MMDRRSPPEPVWTPEARTAPVSRSLIATAAPPTASPNTIARFPTTRTITVVRIPGDGASAAQAATRPNKRLIPLGRGGGGGLAYLGRNRQGIIAFRDLYKMGQ